MKNRSDPYNKPIRILDNPLVFYVIGMLFNCGIYYSILTNIMVMVTQLTGDT